MEKIVMTFFLLKCNDQTLNRHFLTFRSFTVKPATFRDNSLSLPKSSLQVMNVRSLPNIFTLIQHWNSLWLFLFPVNLNQQPSHSWCVTKNSQQITSRWSLTLALKGLKMLDLQSSFWFALSWWLDHLPWFLFCFFFPCDVDCIGFAGPLLLEALWPSNMLHRKGSAFSILKET